MEPKELISIPTMAEFNRVKDELNLTDRQREIFSLKYSRGLRHIDIAEELKIHQDTVTEEMRVIREKLKQYSYTANDRSEQDG